MRAMVCSTGCIEGAAAMNSGRPSARSRRASASRRLRALQSAMQFDLRAQDRQQALILPWLLDEVARAAAHGFDGQSDVAPRGHHDHRDAAVEGDDLREQVKAFLARGGVTRVVQVDQDSIVKFAGQRLAHRGGRLCGIDFEAGGAQQQLERFEDVRLIIGRKDAAGALAIARFDEASCAVAGLCWILANFSPSRRGPVHCVLNLNFIVIQSGAGGTLQLELAIFDRPYWHSPGQAAPGPDRAARSASGSSSPRPAPALSA